MRTGKIYKALILVMLMALTLSGCTTFDSFRHTFIDKNINDENVINIGVYEPESGSNAERGLNETKGIELANSIYNSVDGYRVELIKVDTQSSATAAETAIQGLIKMKPVAIIGSAGEAASLIASQYVDKAEIPAITPSAINPLITQNCHYYFRASLTNAQMGSGAADYACAHLKSRHIGIVVPKNDTLSTALVDGFKDMVKEVLGKDNKAIVLNTKVNADEESFTKVAQEMKEKKVNTLYVPFGTEAMDMFFSVMEKNDLRGVTYIGTKDWGSAGFIKMMDKHRAIKTAFPYLSVVDTENMHEEDVTKEAERFRIEYSNKYGADDIPTDAAALGYDAYLLVINAIHQAKSLEGSDIREALLSLKDVRCATGIFNFDDNGNTVREVNIATIKNGEIVSLHTTEDTTEAEEIGGIE